MDQLDAIATLFEQIGRRIFSHRPPRFRILPDELTMAQGRCLFTLKHHEGCSLRELAAALDVRPSTVCTQVDRLVQLGLVDRTGDENDRRAVRLRLSRRGRSILVRHETEKRTHLRAFLGELSAGQRTAMLEALQALHQAMQPGSPTATTLEVPPPDRHQLANSHVKEA